MASATGQTYHHGDLRQNLIDAAIAFVNEKGISDLSLRQLARQVGVSHNAPYRHFETKEALLMAVAEQGFESLRLALQTAKDMAPNQPAQQLEAIGVAYVNFAFTHPAHYRVMFGNYRSECEESSALAQVAKQAFLVLLNTIQEGQTAGVFRNNDPLNLARVAWSLVHGQSMLILDRKLQVKPGEELNGFLQFSAQILMNGIYNQ
jgi:AcrR family transcriptional regulator